MLEQPVVTASVLCTDPRNRILIVSSARTGAWQLPGGRLDQGESPRGAAVREVREELGLDITLITHDLFVVEWVQGSPGRRDRLAFVFAGPVLGPADTAHIRLQRAELAAWRWADPDDADQALHPAIARRIRGPLQLPGPVTYCEAPLQERNPNP